MGLIELYFTIDKKQIFTIEVRKMARPNKVTLIQVSIRIKFFAHLTFVTWVNFTYILWAAFVPIDLWCTA